MNGNGYDSATKVLPSAFDKDQRTRLEAVTAARALSPQRSTGDWLDIAAFIFSNTLVFREADAEVVQAK